MKCQHCNAAPISRPRRLCWACYYTSGVRDLYPSTSKFGRRGVGNFNGSPPLPPFATSALPGSPAKLAVLEERARLRLSLWHPGDATLAGPTPAIAQAG
jgi:hypothetical protein